MGAHFHLPRHVTTDRYCNLYVTDFINNRVRLVTPTRRVGTLVGTGAFRYTDGKIADAEAPGPLGVAADSWGNVFFTDQVRGYRTVLWYATSPR